MKKLITGIFVFSITACTATEQQPKSSFPSSEDILSINFNLNSIKTMAPGSDNWAVTWVDDNLQITTWGDGGGFGGNNEEGRVSLGVASISGGIEDFKVKNIWGGYNSLYPASFSGKSYGLLAVDNILWMWKTGAGSGDSAYLIQELYYSKDLGGTWVSTGITFRPQDFQTKHTFYAPTFLQFGPGYKNSLDEFVYIYAPERNNNKWDVQVPGRISLIRVPVDKLAQRESYEFFAGIDEKNNEIWTKDINSRSSVFSDKHGVMRTSVTYNSGLKKFLLITQQISRFKDKGFMGVYESTKPWGPWKTVKFDSPWNMGIQNGSKSIFWNFSNMWTSTNGKNFSMIYTGPGGDSFGLIQGEFVLK